MSKWWSWNGQRLANPITIVRRLSMFPILLILRGFFFIALCIGWGLDTAIDDWKWNS